MKRVHEQTALALTAVMEERAALPAGEAEHDFSPAFEADMERLLSRKAPQRRFSTAKRLLTAAVALLLMAVLCVAVVSSHDRRAGFRVEHHSDHAEVFFDDTGRTALDRVYALTAVPEGFAPVETTDLPFLHIVQYENADGAYLRFRQCTPQSIGSMIVDNEHCEIRPVREGGRQVLLSVGDTGGGWAAWVQDGCMFMIQTDLPTVGREELLTLWRSVE